MDIYLTELDTNSRFCFPMLPEEIQFQTANQFYNYSVITTGTVQIPSGQDLDGFIWDGIFPGKARKNDSYIKEWRDPKEIYNILNGWRHVRGKSIKLRLLITETPINQDVYLSDLSGTFKGGYGDFYYQLRFIQAKDIKVYVSGTDKTGGTNTSTTSNQPQGTARPSPPARQNVHRRKRRQYMGNRAENDGRRLALPRTVCGEQRID